MRPPAGARSNAAPVPSPCSLGRLVQNRNPCQALVRAKGGREPLPCAPNTNTASITNTAPLNTHTLVRGKAAAARSLFCAQPGAPTQQAPGWAANLSRPAQARAANAHRCVAPPTPTPLATPPPSRPQAMVRDKAAVSCDGACLNDGQPPIPRYQFDRAAVRLRLFDQKMGFFWPEMGGLRMRKRTRACRRLAPATSSTAPR